MNIEDWEKLSTESQAKDYARQHIRIARGLLMLDSKVEEQYGCNAQHDELFAAGPAPDSDAWDDSELVSMAAWGWRWDASLDSWAIFT